MLDMDFEFLFEDVEVRQKIKQKFIQNVNETKIDKKWFEEQMKQCYENFFDRLVDEDELYEDVFNHLKKELKNNLKQLLEIGD